MKIEETKATIGENVSDVFQEIAQFEKRMGLPPQFYLNLLHESDWGFVIKLYSLFEGAATHILNIRTPDPKARYRQ